MAQCISPIRLKTPDKPKPFRDVPCGKCAACMQRKRFEWSVRLQNELQYASSAAFITLTYSDEYFQEILLMPGGASEPYGMRLYRFLEVCVLALFSPLNVEKFLQQEVWW